MKFFRLSTLTLVMLLLIQLINAQEFTEYQKQQLIVGQDTLNYRLLMPENFDKDKKYPLIIFLHGSGERGNDNEKQLVHGARLFLEKKNRKKYPAIVLFPQCPEDVMWTHRQKEKSPENEWIFTFPLENGPSKPSEMTDILVENYLQEQYVDARRVYIMGLSMGGMGTLEFLYRWPEKYSAAVVICGGNDPSLTKKYCKIPIWFFHGGKDDVVPKKYSENVYNELKVCNKKTRYTLFPEANHNSWDSTFAEPGLLKWLFQQKK